MPDGLVVRLGLGTRDLDADGRPCGSERPRPVDCSDAPVTVDLGAGVIGLAAPPALCAGLARWLVAQFAARAPGGARCVVVDPGGVTDAVHLALASLARPRAPASAVELRTDLPGDRAGACSAGADDGPGAGPRPGASCRPDCAATIRAVAERRRGAVQTAATSVVALADRVTDVVVRVVRTRAGPP